MHINMKKNKVLHSYIKKPKKSSSTCLQYVALVAFSCALFVFIFIVSIYVRRYVDGNIDSVNDIQQQIENIVPNGDNRKRNTAIDSGTDPSSLIPSISSQSPALPLSSSSKPSGTTFYGIPCGSSYNDVSIPDGYEIEKHLCLLPTVEKRKLGLKQDIRVILPETDNRDIHRPSYDNYPATGTFGMPRELVTARSVLTNHPLSSYQITDTSPYTLENVMYYMKNLPLCKDIPIMLTMATVGDDLYWQLIENFVYTMVKFHLSECSLVICVSDSKCMKLCKESTFPCFDYNEVKKGGAVALPSVMEQIAAIKLYHIPKALLQKVDVFMLDLDVGFLADPIGIIKTFYETPRIDIFVQEDYLFIMNRTKAGWKQWFTEPLPNIGLFLCRGNERTAKVFHIAWDKYQKMTNTEMKSHPGKDQNHVLEGMRIGRGTFGLRYAYLSNDSAVLLDKFYRHERTIELGGQAAADLLNYHKSVAIHTTCYEQSTKVMGLKASNSFWNPRYYDPMRLTLTKQILYIDDNQVLDEVRSLIWLAMATGRALIIPNLLGSEKIKTMEKYRDRVLWPAFKVSKFKRVSGKQLLSVDILDPGYYYRIERDYDVPPEPYPLAYNMNKQTLAEIKDSIISIGVAEPRIVLYGSLARGGKVDTDDVHSITTWAKDSVGYYESPYSTEIKRYHRIGSLKSIRDEKGVNDVLQGVRNCMNIFGALKGNRTCFQICD